MGNLQPLIGNPYNRYINPYYWVDDHPLLYGNNGSLDPSTCEYSLGLSMMGPFLLAIYSFSIFWGVNGYFLDTSYHGNTKDIKAV